MLTINVRPIGKALCFGLALVTLGLLASLPVNAAYLRIEGAPLDIESNELGRMGTWYGGVYQYYNTYSWGSVLHISDGGTVHKYSSGYAAGTPFTPVSHAKAGDWAIATVMSAGATGVQVNQRVEYVNGQNYYKLVWTITNESASTYTDLKFFHGGDSFFAGNDSARSYWDPNMGMIYLKNQGVSGLMGFYGGPLSHADHHYGGHYSAGNTQADAGLLLDSADSNFVDAGYYLQWNCASLAPGEIWRITAFEKWTSAANVQVLAPADVSGSQGSIVDATFIVQNFQDNADSFNLSAVSAQGWSLTIQGDNPRTIAGNSSVNVTVRVMLPGGSTTEADSLSLTATSATTPALTNADRVTVSKQYLLVSGISPASGSSDANQAVAVSGMGFTPAASGNNIVRFISDRHVFDVASRSGTTSQSIAATVPRGAPAGTYRVRVINERGTSALSDATYTVSSGSAVLPVVTNVSPLTGGVGTAHVITIAGANFASGLLGAELFVPDSSSAPVALTNLSWTSSTSLTATVPANCPAGVYSIRVKNDAGTYNEVSAVKFEVLTVEDLTGNLVPYTTNQAVDMPADATFPVQTTMTTIDTNTNYAVSGSSLSAAVVFEPGLILEENQANAWQDYAGLINPPRQIPLSDNLLAQLGGGAVAFSLGGQNLLRFKDGRTALVTLAVTLPAAVTNPKIYYVPPAGQIELAGVAGIRNAQTYAPGGTITNIQPDTPEAGYTTYTIGLLLDHMSTYAVGSEVSASALVGDDEKNGPCFVSTAGPAGPMLILGLTLAAMLWARCAGRGSLCGLVALLLIAVPFETQAAQAFARTTASGVYLRQAPDLTAPVHRKLAKQTCLEVLDNTHAEWVKVRLADTEGWVNRAYLSLSRESCAQAFARTTASGVYLRQAPALTAGVHRKLPKGACLKVQADANPDWVQVRFAYTEGWVNRAYLRLSDKACQQMPPAQMQPARVIAASSAFRYEPRDQSHGFARLGTGNRVELLSLRADWSLVRFDGVVGWIRTADLEPLASSPASPGNEALSATPTVPAPPTLATAEVKPATSRWKLGAELGASLYAEECRMNYGGNRYDFEVKYALSPGIRLRYDIDPRVALEAGLSYDWYRWAANPSLSRAKESDVQSWRFSFGPSLMFNLRADGSLKGFIQPTVDWHFVDFDLDLPVESYESGPGAGLAVGLIRGAFKFETGFNWFRPDSETSWPGTQADDLNLDRAFIRTVYYFDLPGQ